MCKGRTHVRVCVATAELVDVIRVRIQLAYERGMIRQWWDGEELTTALVLDKIVKSYMAHMERGRRKRRRSPAPAHLGEVAGRPLRSELEQGDYEVVALREHQKLIDQAVAGDHD